MYKNKTYWNFLWENFSILNVNLAFILKNLSFQNKLLKGKNSLYLQTFLFSSSFNIKGASKKSEKILKTPSWMWKSDHIFIFEGIAVISHAYTFLYTIQLPHSLIPIWGPLLLVCWHCFFIIRIGYTCTLWCHQLLC